MDRVGVYWWIAAAVLVLGFLFAGCSHEGTSFNPLAPSPLGPRIVFADSVGGEDPGEDGIGCSNAKVVWITESYSTDHSGLHAAWRSNGEGLTYEVEVSYSRDGLAAARVIQLVSTTRTSVNLPATEDGGRYYLRVHIRHNDCGDVEGPWSDVLTVYVGGDDTDSAGPPAEESCPWLD